MQSCEIRRRARLGSMTTDLGSPLPQVTPTVTKTVQKDTARVTRRAKERVKPRAKANPNGMGLISGAAKVKVTTSRRKFAAHDRNHEPDLPRHPKWPIIIRTHRGRAVKPDKAVLARFLHAQRKARRENAHHVTLNVIVCHSGRAVFATHLIRARNNTFDLMVPPVPLRWPRRLRMLINQRARRPNLRRRRRKPRRNEANLWSLCMVPGLPPRGGRRAREKAKATMINEVSAFTGSKPERARTGRLVDTIMVLFPPRQSK